MIHSSTGLARAGRSLAAAFLIGLVTAPSGHAVGVLQPTGAPIDAVFVQGRLWVRSDKGVLTSFAETDTAPRVEIASSVLRLCVQNDAPVVAVGEYERGREWRLRRGGGDGWTEMAVVRGGGIYLNAMTCDANGVTLVTAKTTFRVEGGETRMTRFKFERGAREAGEATTSVLSTPTTLYVAYDQDDIGGLFRADLTTGHATPVSGRGSGRCGGPLAGQCDPVHAISPSPQEGCIALAVGQANAPTAGRVLEVCGETVRQIYAKPAGADASVPFVGIARSGPSLWISGGDGLTRLTGERAEYVGVPSMKTVGDYRVTFALPGVVAVQGKDGGSILLAPR